MPQVEIIIPIIMFLGLFGTIITVNVVSARTKLRMKDYELEQMRLANEAKQLEIEEQRLRLTLLDEENRRYDQLGR